MNGLLAFARLACALALAATAITGFAQGYPSRPIKIIVPFGAGGVADITARVLAQKMNETIGQQLVVENRPSAGDIVASEAVAKADPDRVLWGTDWPHPNVKVMPNDGETVDLFAAFCSDETVRRKILVDNPTRLYWAA
ncbi:MAG: hypothetical protein A3H33_09470 [Betaproteobacteria bacterium RIFCSPLOWO2_02_FULL_65_20]|nr:MAG: hypothetical protein A3H33_09470 [Betaproteobacteria bacterium RIFCSPLOWO2_02_FULL_65_20]